MKRFEDGRQLPFDLFSRNNFEGSQRDMQRPGIIVPPQSPKVFSFLLKGRPLKSSAQLVPKRVALKRSLSKKKTDPEGASQIYLRRARLPRAVLLARMSRVFHRSGRFSRAGHVKYAMMPIWPIWIRSGDDMHIVGPGHRVGSTSGIRHSPFLLPDGLLLVLGTCPADDDAVALQSRHGGGPVASFLFQQKKADKMSDGRDVKTK